MIARSDHVTLTNCKHFNFLDMGEDDCIDVCESQDVTIERSIAISLDDSYSFKTWSEKTDIAKTWPGTSEQNHNIVLMTASRGRDASPTRWARVCVSCRTESR